jgi:hypothetical protein
MPPAAQAGISDAAGRMIRLERPFGWIRFAVFVQCGQFPCGFHDHVDPPRKFLAQVRYIHLIGHTIGISDTFDITVLHHLLQTAQRRRARCSIYIHNPTMPSRPKNDQASGIAGGARCGKTKTGRPLSRVLVACGLMITRGLSAVCPVRAGRT